MKRFDCNVRPHRNAIEIRPAGRVGSGVAAGFERILKAFVRGSREHLLLNLAELEFVSSPGLRAILLASHEVRAANRRFLVCTPQPRIEELLGTTGFDRRLDMRDDPKTAVDELAKLPADDASADQG